MHFVSDNQPLVQHSTFTTAEGAKEWFIALKPNNSSPLDQALNELFESYKAFLKEQNLDVTSQIMARIYFSDICNEYETVLKSDLYQLISHGALSLIQQTPINSIVSVFIYHITSSTALIRKKIISASNPSSSNVLLTGKNYNLLWSVNNGNAHLKESYNQTQSIFNTVSDLLNYGDMNIHDNIVRTWIYVRDVDNNYQGMVQARKELFDSIGLTNSFRYIASTGIEGKAASPQMLVSIDALSIGHIQEAQLVRMEAPENMSSTIVYGVTFERGMRIRFGDRSHLYISGTASIDKDGRIVYPFDICNQTHRTIDNIESLLANQGASLTDMNYFLLYLRNYKHYPLIKDIIQNRLPQNIPLIALEAPVCRPGWLVEIEGAGTIKDSTDFKPFL
jgi:enamine deaminase RidA (YjgF/YER057c/UK114 family)